MPSFETEQGAEAKNSLDSEENKTLSSPSSSAGDSLSPTQRVTRRSSRLREASRAESLSSYKKKVAGLGKRKNAQSATSETINSEAAETLNSKQDTFKSPRNVSARPNKLKVVAPGCVEEGRGVKGPSFRTRAKANPPQVSAALLQNEGSETSENENIDDAAKGNDSLECDGSAVKSDATDMEAIQATGEIFLDNPGRELSTKIHSEAISHSSVDLESRSSLLSLESSEDSQVLKLHVCFVRLHLHLQYLQ